jgi:hypothetical protein
LSGCTIGSFSRRAQLHEWVRRMGEWKYSSTYSRPRHLMEVSGQFHTPTVLSWKRDPGTHCIGCWVGPRVVLDAMEVVKRTMSILCSSGLWHCTVYYIVIDVSEEYVYYVRLYLPDYTVSQPQETKWIFEALKTANLIHFIKEGKFFLQLIIFKIFDKIWTHMDRNRLPPQLLDIL